MHEAQLIRILNLASGRAVMARPKTAWGLLCKLGTSLIKTEHFLCSQNPTRYPWNESLKELINEIRFLSPCKCKKQKWWEESSEEIERKHLTFEYKCSYRQQFDRDEKPLECASEISRFLRKSRCGSRVGMHFGGFFQTQYKVDGPCYHWLAPKVNGIFCDRGSNFIIRQCIFPCFILLILIFDPREFMSWTHSGP